MMYRANRPRIPVWAVTSPDAVVSDDPADRFGSDTTAVFDISATLKIAASGL
jgi:hypothetical protein